MSIGKNIKKLRDKHNLSQKEFGEIAGVSDKAVSTWEKGLKEPRMGAIQKIADHFEILKK
ncbi:helix-turn-helix domain-containing protein [Bacillus paranthracis]